MMTHFPLAAEDTQSEAGTAPTAGPAESPETRDLALAHIIQHWRFFAAVLMAMVVWCVVDISRRAALDPQRPGLHMTDLTVYTEAGAAFFDGRQPYDVANIRGWKYLYPPLFAILVAPLHELPPPWQASVFFAFSVLCCFGSYFESRQLLMAWLQEQPVERRRQDIQFLSRLGMVAGCAVLFPALNCLQRGQVAVVTLYPLLLGFRLVLLGRSPVIRFIGGVVLVLPVVIKVIPLLPVACLLMTLLVSKLYEFQQKRRSILRVSSAPGGRRSNDSVWPVFLGVTTGAILFVLVVPAAFIGWKSNLRHFATWFDRIATKVDHDRTDTFAGMSTSVRNQSLLNGVQRFGNWFSYQFTGGPDDRLLDHGAPPLGGMPMDADWVRVSVDLIRFLTLVVLGGGAVVLGFTGGPVSLGFSMGLGTVAAFIVSPVARGHYFVLYLPGLLYGGLWIRAHVGDRRAIQFVSIPMSLCLLHYIALKYSGRIGLLGIGTTLWFFAASACVIGQYLHSRTRDLADISIRDVGTALKTPT